MAVRTKKHKPKTGKKKLSFKRLFKIIRNTVKGFNEDNVSRLSASLAYATLFSIIPFFSLLVTIGSFLEIDLGSHLYMQLRKVIGVEVVAQLREIIENAMQVNHFSLAGIVSLAASIFGATAIFAEIQNSLNTIWGIKAIPKKGWLKYIKNRLLSFSIILMFAFVMLVTFVITNAINYLSNSFMSRYPEMVNAFAGIAGFATNIIVMITIFVLIFKILPDARIKTKDVLVGAVVTTLLFVAGQWAISLYIKIADVGTVYGAAAFLAILITWIYYSAFIIYIGAEFTESWAMEMGGKIIPDEFAVATKTVEVHDENTVPVE